MTTDFNNIPQLIARNPAQTIAALNEIGDFVLEKAQGRASVKGEGSADGYYSSPWAVRDPSRVGAVRKSIQKTMQPNKVVIGSNHMIAPKLEHGSSRETPKPFMRPSIDENRNEIVAMFTEKLVDSIKAVTR